MTSELKRWGNRCDEAYVCLLGQEHREPMPITYLTEQFQHSQIDKVQHQEEFRGGRQQEMLPVDDVKPVEITELNCRLLASTKTIAFLERANQVFVEKSHDWLTKLNGLQGQHNELTQRFHHKTIELIRLKKIIKKMDDSKPDAYPFMGTGNDNKTFYFGSLT